MPKTVNKAAAAKARQGYREQAGCCFDCARFRQLRTRKVIDGISIIEDSPPRCLLGDFEVKRTGTCNEYDLPF